MNISKKENCLNEASFNRELTTILQIVWERIWSTVYLEPLNAEPLRTYSSVLYWLITMPVNAAFPFKIQKHSLLTAHFNAIGLKRILPWFLIMTIKYS